MVAFAPGGGAVAAGEAAVPVAYDQGVVQGGGDGAGGGAVVEDGGAALGEDPVQGGVAEQPLERGAVETGAVDGGGTGTGQGPVAVDVEDDVDVGAVPATAAGLLVIEEEPADVAEGVGAAGGRAAGGFAVGVGGFGRGAGRWRGVRRFRRRGWRRDATARRGCGTGAVPWAGSGLGSRLAVALFPPGPHGGGDVAHRQVDQGGQHHGFVVGEQPDGVGVEVGGDGLDLAAGQHPVPPRRRGGG